MTAADFGYRTTDSHGIRMAEGDGLIWIGRADGDGRWITPEAFQEFAGEVAKFAASLQVEEVAS